MKTDMPSATVAEKVQKAYEKNSKKLSPREREIVSRYYGLGGNLRHTLQELGIQYEVTRERIRQIKATALAKIEADI